ncbi:Surfeit locus protein 1 [Hibiscus syriacus]|uniref:SURF1-like protein n=1 Tax=Hibiscus syriacus TaxID=106335 RepID=A0A6A3C9W9_HIBSY|nr:Surfeit locus protein 1 [Hibiscus syriacus]
MASNLRGKTSIISNALTRKRPDGAFYAVSNQSLPPKHWVPSSSFYISTSADTAAAAASSSSSFQSHHDKEKGSNWSRWFLFLPGAITFGLGTWQIFRRQDKEWVKYNALDCSATLPGLCRSSSVSISFPRHIQTWFMLQESIKVLFLVSNWNVSSFRNVSAQLVAHVVLICIPLIAIKMLDYRQKRLEMEPLKLNNMSPSNEILETLEFRRVVCKGVFDNGRSIYIGPRSRSISGVTENGYYVITPLMPISCSAERLWSQNSELSCKLECDGFLWRDKSFEVPQAGEKSSSMNAVPAQGNEQSWWRMFRTKNQKAVEDQAPAITSVEVTGVVRGSEKPSIFVPANDPNSGQWFYVDVPAIAVACGLPKETLLIEDINENVDPSNPYPVPKDVNALIHSILCLLQLHLWLSRDLSQKVGDSKHYSKRFALGTSDKKISIESLRDIADCKTGGLVENVARKAIPMAPPDFLSMERNR